MRVPENWASVIRLASFTIADEARQKSFIAILIICALFILMVRGCYHGDYMMNGQVVDSAKIIIMVSKITLHIIAGGVLFLAALLSMRIFRRDRGDGTQSCILSKPVSRRQYVSGKILGLWVLLTAVMIVLHGIVFLITSVSANMVMPEFFSASIWCSLNVLFVVLTVLLLSMMMPDIAALLCVIGIGMIGVAADGVFAVRHSPIGQAMMQHDAPSDFSVWQIIYTVWPKLFGVQSFAASRIGAEGFGGPVFAVPILNVGIYCMIIGALLFWRFGKEDID